MGEKVGQIAKVPEVKESSSNSRVRMTEHLQSMNSPVDSILFLQKNAGNQAVSRLIKSGTLQAKLRIGQPGDKYEQEADRVVEQVMRMPEPQAASNSASQLQRGCDEDELRLQQIEEDEEELQRQPIEEEEEKFLQTKVISEQNTETTPDLEARINVLKGGGQPLPDSERAFYEMRFGHDFGQVQVHTDSKAAESAREVNARAFTVGHDIYFDTGQYQPKNSQGQKLLAHELTHVIHQSRYTSIIQRDLDQSALERRARTIFDAVRVWEGTNEGAIIEALRGLSPNDAAELTSIYNRVYSSQREGRNLMEDLAYELEDPIHRYRAFNLLHYRVHPPGEPSLGVTRSHITANPEIREVVPSAQVTYTMETPQEILPAPSYQYRWLVRNDPRTVQERRRTASGQNTPYFFEGPRTAHWEATWVFPGRHTVVCELHINRQIEGYYEYLQVVREPERLAEETFEQQAEVRRPDLYLLRLELQLAHLRMGNVQHNANQIRQLEEVIERARLLLEVPGEFMPETRTGEMGARIVPAGGPGPSRSMRAILVPTVRPEPVLLRLYAKPLRNGRFAIIDLTDPVGRFGPFEGSPEPGLQGEEAIRSAVQAAWINFVTNNQHPAGQIVGEPPEEFGFPEGTRWNVHNNGISDLEQVSQWISRVGLVVGLGALAVTFGLLPVPGSRPVAVALLFVSSSIAGATATTLQMLDRAQYGDLRWDIETALNLVDLAGNLAVGAGNAARILGSRALLNIGLRSAWLISEGIETGSDLASGVIISTLHYSRIQGIQQRYQQGLISREEATLQIENILGQALLQNTLILLGTIGTIGTVRGSRLELPEFQMRHLASITDVNELQRRLNNLPDETLNALTSIGNTARSNVNEAIQRLHQLEGLTEADRRIFRVIFEDTDYGWRLNPPGQTRTTQEAVEIARSRNIDIPDYVYINEVEQSSLIFQPSHGRRTEEIARRREEDSARAIWYRAQQRNVEEVQNWDTRQRELVVRQGPQQVEEQRRLEWEDLYDDTNRIRIDLSNLVLESDDAIEYVLRHEMHEINGIRRFIEEEHGGIITRQQLQEKIDILHAEANNFWPMPPHPRRLPRAD